VSGAFHTLVPIDDAAVKAALERLASAGWRRAGPTTWEDPAGAVIRLVDHPAGVNLIEVEGPAADEVARRIAAVVPTWTLDAVDRRVRHAEGPEIMLHAIHRLGLLHPPHDDGATRRYVEVWSRTLHHPDRHVRLETLRAMRYRSPSLLRALLADAELDEPDNEVQAEIRRTLDSIPAAAAPPDDETVLDDDLPF
jgi:hypothetical protein